MSSRLRRPSTLALYWRDGAFTCENYCTRSIVGMNPQGAVILDYFGEWRTSEACCARFPEYSSTSILASIEQLAKQRLLLREGSQEAEADTQCAHAWQSWLPSAGFFHFATRDTPYLERAADVREALENRLMEAPQPSLHKAYPDTDPIDMPPPLEIRSDFVDVLRRRRTIRRFSSEPLPLSSLSTLLYLTWGVMARDSDPMLGQYALKTSPSGGARHPEEVYVLALRVDGLKSGLYHYACDRHLLERLSCGCTPEDAVRYTAGQEWIGEAAALFIMTAVFARTMWKYPVPRSYRVILAEAGHLCQTFCLVATSLGLAPFSTMAVRESAIESSLGLNSFEEPVLYVAGVGMPPESGAA